MFVTVQPFLVSSFNKLLGFAGCIEAGECVLTGCMRLV